MIYVKAWTLRLTACLTSNLFSSAIVVDIAVTIREASGNKFGEVHVGDRTWSLSPGLILMANKLM